MRARRADRLARRRGLLRRGVGRPPLRGSARLLRPAPVRRAPRGGRDSRPASPTRWSSARRRSTAAAASSPSWTSPSWAARWEASSARSSRAPATRPPSAACRSSPSRAPAARACRRGSSRSCSCRRRSPRSRTSRDSGQAMISVMAHPTTGGVLASFATLGDVLLAEPGALMSFAGPRVVQQITREKLPDDFGLAEQNLPLREHRRDRPAARAARRRSPSSLRLFDAPNPPSEHELRLRERLEQAPQHAAARRREAFRRARSPPAPARPHRRGADRRGDLALASSSHATSSARTRSTTSSGSSTTGSSSTATAATPTTAR